MQYIDDLSSGLELFPGRLRNFLLRPYPQEKIGTYNLWMLSDFCRN